VDRKFSLIDLSANSSKTPEQQGKKAKQQQSRECFAPAYLESISRTQLPWAEALDQRERIRIQTRIMQGENLTFEEARSGMCFPLAATNPYFLDLLWDASHATDYAEVKSTARSNGVAMLVAMACKEFSHGLTSEEIAGVVAATFMDIMFRLEIPRVVETCGMGADRGFKEDGVTKKSINVSTLSAIVLSALGLPTIKHGSYAGTSVAGSTDAIERFGVNTSMRSVAEIMQIWKSCNFCYLDAHLCKTIHDLSHRLEFETINHLVGPMTLPVSMETEINKLMGVNHNVHPAVIAQAYTLLHQCGVQRMGGVVIVGGLAEDGMGSDPTDPVAFKKHCILDEVSPYASVVSIAYQDRFLGSFMVRPEDFGISIDPEAIQVANESEAIHRANVAALQDNDHTLADYLAMNAALGLFAERHLSNNNAVEGDQLNSSLLRECYGECREIIASELALKKLVQYIETSGGDPSLL